MDLENSINGCKELQELSTAYWKSSILFTANKLDIFTKISGKKFNVEQIASVLDTKVDTKSLEKFLDACVAIGLLKKNKHYENSDLSENFLVRGKAWYQGDVVAHWADMFAAGHSTHLDFSVKNGAPVPNNMLHHESFDDKRDGLENWVLGMHNWAMAGHAELLANSIDLKGGKRLLDVGGGSGTYSIFLCKKYPALSSIVLDDAHIVDIARKIIDSFGLSDRIKCVSGNFLTSNSIQECDVVLLSNVIHMGNEKFSQMILAKAFERLPEGGLLIVQDWFLDSTGTHPMLSLLFSMHIMSRTGGRLYSFDEMANMLVKTGFSKVEKQSLSGMWGVVVCRK